MSAARVAVCALAVAALAWGSASAGHCAGPTTSRPLLTLHWVGGHGLYAAGDVGCFVADAAMCAVFVYEEANDIAGLQRADGLVDDTCHGDIAGDRIVS